jgi:hypothetical protein
VKKFRWKEFGSELLGGLMELLIMLPILGLGWLVIWLMPDSLAEFLNYDIELVGFGLVFIAAIIFFIIKSIINKIRK